MVARVAATSYTSCLHSKINENLFILNKIEMAAELIKERQFLNELNSDHVLNAKVGHNEVHENEISNLQQPKNMQQEQHQQKPNGNKRLRCETPPTTDSEDAGDINDKGEKEMEAEMVKSKKSKLLRPLSPSSSPPPSLSITHNHQNILASIQMKILQLQNDLNELNDSEADDEDSERVNIDLKISAQEAEAIGFATCAQETLLFLQHEGISNESELYKKLRETLTGKKHE